MNARQRCNNPNYKQFADYGGRGIEFRFDSFEEFYAELGPRPPGLVVDRINNNGHYEKGNIQWATRSQSSFNRRPYVHYKNRNRVNEPAQEKHC